MNSRLLAIEMLASFLVACGDSGSGPATGPPARLVILDGASQTGVFGQSTAVVPRVLVTDAANQPVRGVAVSFAVAPGSGTLGSAAATTDATGTATPGEWKLGSSFATMALTATVTGLAPVNFTARAIAPDAGVLAFTITDPAGDTLPTAVTTNPRAHDVLSVRGDYKRDSLILTLTFAAPVSASSTATALYGFIELDTDETVSTGATPLSNTFGATAAAGIDYLISLSGGTTAAVRASAGGTAVSVPVLYAGNTAIIRVPMLALGSDDGRFTFVGVIGTFDRPTDVFPNASTIAVRPIGSVPSGYVASSASRIDTTRPRGEWPTRWHASLR